MADMTEDDLQEQINALAAFAARPEAAWIQRVQRAPNVVIIGAILQWDLPRVDGGSYTAMGADQMVARRQAAQAVLQARLSEQNVESTNALGATIDAYQRASTRQTRWMLGLTWVIAALTVAQIAIVLWPHK
jgi:hypothetical protein